MSQLRNRNRPAGFTAPNVFAKMVTYKAGSG